MTTMAKYLIWTGIFFLVDVHSFSTVISQRYITPTTQLASSPHDDANKNSSNSNNNNNNSNNNDGVKQAANQARLEDKLSGLLRKSRSLNYRSGKTNNGPYRNSNKNRPAYAPVGKAERRTRESIVESVEARTRQFSTESDDYRSTSPTLRKNEKNDGTTTTTTTTTQDDDGNHPNVFDKYDTRRRTPATSTISPENDDEVPASPSSVMLNADEYASYSQQFPSSVVPPPPPQVEDLHDQASARFAVNNHQLNNNNSNNVRAPASSTVYDYNNNQNNNAYNNSDVRMAASVVYDKPDYATDDVEPLDAEELHRRVMRDEAGYLNNRTRNNNDDAAADNIGNGFHTAARSLASRNARYRQRQEQAMQRVDEEMADLMRLFADKKKQQQQQQADTDDVTSSTTTSAAASAPPTPHDDDRPGAALPLVHCRQCGCELMDREEIRRGKTCRLCHAEQFEFHAGVSVTAGPGKNNQYEFKQDRAAYLASDDPDVVRQREIREEWAKRGMDPAHVEKANNAYGTSFMQPIVPFQRHNKKNNHRHRATTTPPTPQTTNTNATPPAPPPKRSSTTSQQRRATTSNGQRQRPPPSPDTALKRQQEDPTIRRLKADVAGYKALHETTLQEMDQLRRMVSQLEDKLQTVLTATTTSSGSTPSDAAGSTTATEQQTTETTPEKEEPSKDATLSNLREVISTVVSSNTNNNGALGRSKAKRRRPDDDDEAYTRVGATTTTSRSRQRQQQQQQRASRTTAASSASVAATAWGKEDHNELLLCYWIAVCMDKPRVKGTFTVWRRRNPACDTGMTAAALDRRRRVAESCVSPEAQERIKHEARVYYDSHR